MKGEYYNLQMAAGIGGMTALIFAILVRPEGVMGALMLASLILMVTGFGWRGWDKKRLEEERAATERYYRQQQARQQSSPKPNINQAWSTMLKRGIAVDYLVRIGYKVKMDDDGFYFSYNGDEYDPEEFGIDPDGLEPYYQQKQVRR